MHETLHTYHFLAFGEKTPSLLFMLRKEKNPCFVIISMLSKNRSLLLWQGWWSCISRSLLRALAHFHFYEAFAEAYSVFDSRVIDVIWCMMWCYEKWCDDVMQNDTDAEDTHPHAHTGTHKLCIPLGTSFELLRLLFRRYKFCIPFGMTFEQKTYAALP